MLKPPTPTLSASNSARRESEVKLRDWLYHKSFSACWGRRRLFGLHQMLSEPLGRGPCRLVGARSNINRIVAAVDFQQTFWLASPGEGATYMWTTKCEAIHQEMERLIISPWPMSQEENRSVRFSLLR
jgi:hypothetical protein